MTAQATLLPNGKQAFTDANGGPLVSGKVYFYIPNTSTLKDTWQDKDKTILNTNPIILDARGEAIIYGAGAYRQVLQDSLGNTIWDQLTTDAASATASLFFGTSVTANNITSGSKTFITQTGLGFGAGMFVTAVYSVDPTQYMFGSVASYNPFTGSLVINVVSTAGSGTYSSWNIAPSGFATVGSASFRPGPLGTIASATTTDLATTGVFVVLVTGTTTITSFGSTASTASPLYFVRFSGVLTLTNNGTTFQLPGGANIATEAGDELMAEYLGSGNWKIWFYQRAGASPLPDPGTSGNLLISNGTIWTSSAVAGIKTVKLVTFGISGTYTPTAGMVYCIAEAVGGGGGSGGCAANNESMSGAGAGGGYARKVLSAAAIGVSQTVTIGAGGTAGTTGPGAGGNGGNTSLGALITANGGTGGLAATTVTIGVIRAGVDGGSGSGDISIGGQPSTYGMNISTNIQVVGCGGGSYFSPMARGGNRTSNVVAITGANSGYAGSGASAAMSGGSAQAGAAGADGLLIITEFLSV